MPPRVASSHGVVLGKGSLCVLALESSWRDGIIVVVPLLPGKAAASGEGPSRPIVVEAGFERNAVRSARRGTWCAQGARFLGCVCFRAEAGSPSKRIAQLVRHEPRGSLEGCGRSRPFLGEFVMSRGPSVSRMGNLATACDE